ncbi:MAG: oligosaccharide flippase family protein [Deltaproteobacteria bacterium]|nr:oligosaccharide flippase family protein [Deltaproteobacteria bacterium]
MPDEGFSVLKRKSLAGIGTLLKRQIFVTGIAFVGNIALARILVPRMFGIYAIVAFVVQFFSVFSDVGVGAALIQKKDELTDEETSTLFWFQQILALAVVIATFVSSPLVIRIYPSLPESGAWLVRGMAVTFLLASFRTVPTILMERSMDFRRIATVDIAEVAVFQVTAISLAIAGFGVWSFIIAALFRGLSGMLLVYALYPWRPSMSFRPGAVKDLIRFGIPYQGSAILSFLKDAVTPLFVGAYVGAAGVGYVNWAREFAFAPLVLSQSFGKVAFPAFSRLQHERDLLKEAIERSLRMMTLIMIPITAILMALAPGIIKTVFTDKWMPAINAFYFYCTSPFVIGIMLPLYSGILALGKSGILMKMAILLLCLEWGLGVPFVLAFGFNGMAFNQPIIAMVFLFVYKRVLAGEGIRVEILKNVWNPIVASCIVGVAVKFGSGLLTVSLPNIGILFGLGGSLFLALQYTFRKEVILEFHAYTTEIFGYSRGKA